MIDRNSDFFRLSKEIAADFLQSTVIIDDYGASEFSSSKDQIVVGTRAGIVGRQSEVRLRLHSLVLYHLKRRRTSA